VDTRNRHLGSPAENFGGPRLLVERCLTPLLRITEGTPDELLNEHLRYLLGAAEYPRRGISFGLSVDVLSPH
jgi:hypothetical protein